jgi:hypothetical protein
MDQILDLIITELQTKLDESYKDFEILGLDWEKLDSLLKSKVILSCLNNRGLMILFPQEINKIK